MSVSAFAACNIQPSGSYRYLDDLLHLDAQRAVASGPFEHLFSVICLPLIASALVRNWAYHPDAGFASYIVDSISEGFRIGYSQAASSALASVKKKMRCAHENHSVVVEYIAKELNKGRLVGPIPCDAVSSASQLFHLSPFEVIPKQNHPGKWHLIVDLSSLSTKV